MHFRGFRDKTFILLVVLKIVLINYGVNLISALKMVFLIYQKHMPFLCFK